jgi:hypothetical protein
MRRQKTAIKFRHLPVRRKLLVDDEDEDDEDDIFGNDDSSDGGDSFQNDLSDLVNAFKSGLSDEDYVSWVSFFKGTCLKYNFNLLF